jgi:hypothetical protein
MYCSIWSSMIRHKVARASSLPRLPVALSHRSSSILDHHPHPPPSSTIHHPPSSLVPWSSAIESSPDSSAERFEKLFLLNCIFGPAGCPCVLRRQVRLFRLERLPLSKLDYDSRVPIRVWRVLRCETGNRRVSETENFFLPSLFASRLGSPTTPADDAAPD